MVRNDLFEQVIKSCKGTNTDFLIFKEKLGICFYKEIYYEVENIQIQNEETIEEISKVSNKKSTKKLTKELIEESDKKSNKKLNKESNKESNEELTRKMFKVLNKYDDSDKELD